MMFHGCLTSESSADSTSIRSRSNNGTLHGLDIGQCASGDPFSMPMSMNHIGDCYPFSDPALVDDLRVDTLNPQSVLLPTPQVWDNNIWHPISEALVPNSVANATMHNYDNKLNIQRFPPTPPIAPSYLAPPVSTQPYYNFSDYSHPYVPGRTQSESAEFRCSPGPPATSSASSFKRTVASDGVKQSSLKRRKYQAKFVCETCGDDFTAQHNLKSKYSDSKNCSHVGYL
jgi:hypothetical protein